MNKNQIFIHNSLSNSTWLGMTYREDLDILKHNIEELIKKGEYPEKLWD